MRKVDRDLVSICIDFIQTTYSFEDYLEKNNLLDTKEVTGLDSFSVSCPFHLDKTPSFIVDSKRNIYNCLSCGHGGNLINFMSAYSTEVLGVKKNYMDTIEHLLRKDLVMQMRTKTNSIYKPLTFDISGLRDKKIGKLVSFSSIAPNPNTVLELSGYVKREFPNDHNVVMTSISLMEDGLNPSDIYERLKGIKTSNRFEGVNLEDFLND